MGNLESNNSHGHNTGFVSDAYSITKFVSVQKGNLKRYMGKFSTLDLKLGMLHKENRLIHVCLKAWIFLQKQCQ